MRMHRISSTKNHPSQIEVDGVPEAEDVEEAATDRKSRIASYAAKTKAITVEIASTVSSQRSRNRKTKVHRVLSHRSMFSTTQETRVAASRIHISVTKAQPSNMVTPRCQFSLLSSFSQLNTPGHTQNSSSCRLHRRCRPFW